MDTETASKLTLIPLIMGPSLIIAAGLLSWGIYASRVQADTLSVTGSAKRAVTADMAKWNGNFSRPVMIDALKDGYAQMTSDQKAVEKFFSGRGITPEHITIGNVSMEQIYEPSGGPPRQAILRQNVQIASEDIEKVTGLSKDFQALVDQGIIFSSNPVEYYYSGLASLRVELLADAVKDAEARAQAIAGSTNKRLGNLTTASMGVVQVLAPNSVDISDYGAYDTSSVAKEVMVTVRAEFALH